MKGERLFNAAFFGFLERLFVILSFEEIAGAGSVEASRGLAAKYASLMRGLAAGGADGNRAESLAADLAVRASERSAATVSAACFVYAYTLLDAAASDYCRAAADARPEDWPDLPAPGAAVGEKVDLLSARCPAPDGWKPGPGLKLERSRLERLRRLRDAAVHEGAPVPKAEEEMSAMVRCALFLAGLVSASCGFRIDPRPVLTRSARR